MTPLFTSPCDLAERIPAMTAGFLELETQIGRRFREDSITDIIIASLLKIGGDDATVFTPPEMITGGDFDLVIYQPTTRDCVQYRIQSKRLIPHASNWLWSSYRELDHPHGTGKQASTLIRSSVQEKLPTIPLYAFYNTLSACEASDGEISGIQLAGGRQINAIVRELVKAKAIGKRPRWKRVEYLRHLFFPLSTILCPATDDSLGESLIIGPDASRRAAISAIDERQITLPDVEDALPQLNFQLTEQLRLPSPDRKTGSVNLPALTYDTKLREIPRVVERALNRQPEHPAIQKARIKRPKLILLSR